MLPVASPTCVRNAAFFKCTTLTLFTKHQTLRGGYKRWNGDLVDEEVCLERLRAGAYGMVQAHEEWCRRLEVAGQAERQHRNVNVLPAERREQQAQLTQPPRSAASSLRPEATPWQYGLRKTSKLISAAKL